MHATDGDLGRARDFLFDDVGWVVRYVVVDTGKWLPGRQLLVSPASVVRADWLSSRLFVALTKEQINASPPIESNQPVSRQEESQLAEYYAWPVYWGPAGAGTLRGAGAVAAYAESDPQKRGDPDLRSVNEVTGYHVRATDGRIGHIEEVIADDSTWAIRYVVVNTRNWLPGRKVAIDPHWFTAVRWTAEEVDIGLDREVVKNGPEYDPSVPINREFETRLYDYYGRPYYW